MAIELTSSWAPDWAVAPGEVLREILEERGMTQAELARRTDRPLKTINEIVKGKAAITPETAIQFERVLGPGARFWNSLENNYREARARRLEQLELERNAAWLDLFPVRDLVRYGVVPASATKSDMLRRLFSFFQVSSRSAWENNWLRPAAAFRGSPTFSATPEAVATWLRWGELQANDIRSGAFSSARFRSVVEQSRYLTTHLPISVAISEVQQLCASAGVAFVMTPELPGAPLSGSARWLSQDKALIQLSLRHKSDDQLWFSFFHESAHILLSKRKETFLDAADGVGEATGSEDQANQFARDLLITPTAYASFLDRNDLSAAAIRAFAREVGVAPGIVVGRLQQDQRLARSQMNPLKRTVRWIQSPYGASSTLKTNEAGRSISD